MNDKNQVKIVGRVKDMIIRGGENIYPTEIEAILYTHEHVEDVHVVCKQVIEAGARTARRWACPTRVWAKRFARGFDCTVTRQTLSPTMPSNSGAGARWGVLLHGRRMRTLQIAHFKIPRYIQFKNEAEFPLTITGKVQKFKIRQIAMRELALDKDEHDFKFVDDTDENKSQ
jgi:acyl-CoA synthetase (AMP-forming)/AMP-acid ligase II